MSSLFVYHLSSPQMPNKVLTHLQDIASTLAEYGVVVDRWEAATPVRPGAIQDEVIYAYRDPIDRLMTERSYATVEALSVDSDSTSLAQAHAELAQEHCHDEDELLLVVSGRGLLGLHIDDYVYALHCERNDRVLVPAGLRRWLDLGEQPRLTVIRLFKAPQGRVPQFTGDDIADRFPRLED